MSSIDELLSHFRMRSDQYGLDYNGLSNQLLNFLGGEQPIAFVFGRGFAPENPTTIVDLLVLTSRLLLGLNMQARSSSLVFFKVSEIGQVLLSNFPERIRLQIALSGLGSGVYINTGIEEYPNILRFALLIRDSMRSLI